MENPDRNHHINSTEAEEKSRRIKWHSKVEWKIFKKKIHELENKAVKNSNISAKRHGNNKNNLNPCGDSHIYIAGVPGGERKKWGRNIIYLQEI